MNANIVIGVLLSAVGGIVGQSTNYGVPAEHGNYNNGQYAGPQTYYGYQDPVGTQYGQQYGGVGAGGFPMAQMPVGDILSLLDTAQFLLDMARHAQYSQGAAAQEISRMMGAPAIPQQQFVNVPPAVTTAAAYSTPQVASASEPVYGVPVYVGGVATPPAQASAPTGVQYASSSASYATNAESGSAALTSVDGQPTSYVAMMARPNHQPVVMASTGGQPPVLVSGGGAAALPTVANSAPVPKPPLAVR